MVVESIKSGTTPIVLYHAQCRDGFCAAWLLHRVIPDAEFVAVQYGDPPPSLAGREAYIVDFSYKRDVLERLHAEAKSLVVLDHHKTAKAELAGLDYCTFDMEKSGAMLTYDYITERYGEEQVLDTLPLVKYVQEHDFRRFEQYQSRRIRAALSHYPMVFEAWDDLATAWDDSLNFLISQGKTIEKVYASQAATIASHAYERVIGGYRVMAVNNSTLISDVCEQMMRGDVAMACCYFQVEDGSTVYSLRSRVDGPDVSDLACKYGGGGHEHAAGFKLPPHTYPGEVAGQVIEYIRKGV